MSWVPDYPHIGLHDIDIEISDGIDSVTQTLRLMVRDDPSVRTHVGRDFIIKPFESGATTEVLITSEYDVHGTMTIEGLDLKHSFSVAANSSVNIPLPLEFGQLQNLRVRSDKAKRDQDLYYGYGSVARIQTDYPVSVYYVTGVDDSTDSSVIYPVRNLGAHYRTLAWNTGSIDDTAGIAALNETTAIINPHVPFHNEPRGYDYTQGPLVPVLATPNSPYPLQLGAQESFSIFPENVTPQESFSGSEIIADNPLLVMSENYSDNVFVGSYSSASDLMTEITPAISQWGNAFYISNFRYQQADAFLRIIAHQDDTKLTISAPFGLNPARTTSVVLNAGQVYGYFPSTRFANEDTLAKITSDKPILIAQFHPSLRYQYVNRRNAWPEIQPYGDPAMMLLTPQSAGLTQYRFTVPGRGFRHHSIHLFIAASALDTLRLDGQPLANAQVITSPISDVVGVRLGIEAGTHHLSADEPFTLYQYGLGVWDSYAHAVGRDLRAQPQANVIDLSTVTNAYVVGNEACISGNAALTTLNGSVPHLNIDYWLIGPHTDQGHLISDENGNFEYCYTGNKMGEDRFIVYRDGVEQEVLINWQENSGALSIVSKPKTITRLSELYQYDLKVVGNVDAIELVQAPSGARLEDGVLTWDASGTQGDLVEFEIRVSDAENNTSTQNFTIALTSPYYEMPVFTSVLPTDVPAGETQVYEILATGGNNRPITYGVSKHYDAEDGFTTSTAAQAPHAAGILEGNTFKWKPITTKPHFIGLSVNDGRFTVFQWDEIHVDARENNQAPVFTSPKQLPYRYRNAENTFTLAADDPNGDSVYFRLDTRGSDFWPIIEDPYSGEITIPDNRRCCGGRHNFIIELYDGTSGPIRKEFTFWDVINGNQPPIINNQAPTNAIVNQAYSHQVDAADPDGDALTYTLENAPDSMSISDSGLITWIPGHLNVGQVNFEIVIEDSNNTGALQEVSIEVVSLTPNQAPIVTSVPPIYALEGQAFAYDIEAYDPDAGDRITFSDIDGSYTWARVNRDTGLVTFNVPSGGSRSPNFTVTITDGLLITEHSFTLQVVTPGQAEQLGYGVDINKVTPPPAEIFPTLDFEYQVTATSNHNLEYEISGLPAGATIDENGLIQWAPLSDELGDYQVTVTASNELLSDTYTFDLSVVRDGVDPVFDLNNVEVGQEITAPLTVNASVYDDTLIGWSLYYRKKGSEAETLMATGDTVIDNQDVAEFDPTLLANGMYELVLQADEAGGFFYRKTYPVILSGGMKLGEFSITLTDVDLEMAGLPLSVSRNYDSRRRNEIGDFGYGWRLAETDVRVEETIEPTIGWTIRQQPRTLFDFDGPNTPPYPFPALCYDSTNNKRVSVTLPTGKVEFFDVRLRPVNYGNTSLNYPNCYFTGGLVVELLFDPEEDTDGTLEIYGGVNGFHLDNQTNGKLLASIEQSEAANVVTYRYTAKNGMVYDIHQIDGLERIVDLNGNSVNFTEDGINHSLNRDVTYQRDAQDRITSVTDPKGLVTRYEYNVAGELVASTDPEGNRTRYTYIENHYLEDIFDPLDRRIVRNVYDDNGRMVSQIDADGNETNFDHDIEGRQSIVRDRLGRSTQLFYDDQGNVTTRIDAAGNTWTYSFDGDFNQLTETNPLGEVTRNTYDDNNNVLTTTDPLNNTTTYTYNRRGQETSVTDALNRAYTIDIDERYGNLLGITDPVGNEADQNYNRIGRMIRTVDVEGNVTNYTYADGGDSHNKETEEDPEGNITRYTYDDNDNMLSESRTRMVNGTQVTETTHYEYDDNNRLIRTTDALGNLSQSEYDAVGNEVATIDALGRRTEMDYDVYGRQTQTRYPDGTNTNKVYDAEGNLLEETDRLGRTTLHEYDSLNRLVRTTYPDNTQVRNEYDGAGRMIAVIDANQNRMEYEYDAAGQRILTRDALGNEHRFEYDAVGNLVAEVDANNHRTEYEYNDLDQRILTRFVDSTNQGEGFDALSRRTSQTDQAGVVTQYVYDGLGRLTQVTDAEGNATTFTYDEVGNKLTQTDAEGRTTSWTYDALGRVLSRTLPEGQSESFTYNAVGSVITHTDFNGATNIHTYDDDNDRLLRTDYEDGSFEAFTYFDNGLVETAENQFGTTTYIYDDRDRLTQETRPDGSVLAYQYDSAGNRLQVSVTANAETYVTDYTYDDLNRLATIIDTSGTTSYTYDAVGNRASVTYPNGNATSYTYDGLNRLTRLETLDAADNVLVSYDYTLHPTGRRTGIQEASGRNSVYEYDLLYRLVRESITDAVNGNHQSEYTYDRVGNRTYSIINGVHTAYTYDNNDRLLQQGGTRYTYDANGNTLTETLDSDLTEYMYTDQNRMVQAEVTTAGITNTTTYEYDANGIRIRKTELGDTTDFIVDSNRDYAQVLVEASNDANYVQYTYGDDLISQNRVGATSFYLYDGLGSTRGLSDAAGAITDRYDYEAFGAVLNSEGATENTYLFTGEQFDADLDQYYLRARYYDPGSARFTQQDTWMGRDHDPVTLHKYVYTHSDSVNNIDPTGHYTLGQISAATNVQGLLVAQGQVLARHFLQRAVTAFIKKQGQNALKHARKLVRECLRKPDKCGLKVPTLIVGHDNFEAAEHIRRYQMKYKRGFVLTYKSRRRTNFQRGKCVTGLFGPITPAMRTSLDCDEYPFFRSVQGGPRNTVSFAYINRGHNRSSGAIFGALIRLAKLRTKNDKDFLVLAPTDAPVSVPLPVK